MRKWQKQAAQYWLYIKNKNDLERGFHTKKKCSFEKKQKREENVQLKKQGFDLKKKRRRRRNVSLKKKGEEFSFNQKKEKYFG